MIFSLNKINYKNELDEILFSCAELGLSVGIFISAIGILLQNYTGIVAYPFYGMIIGMIFGMRYNMSLIQYENDRRGIEKIKEKKSLVTRIYEKISKGKKSWIMK